MRRRSLLTFSIAICLSTTIAGCGLFKTMTGRGQNPDNEIATLDPDTQDYIGDITELWGVSYAKVEGIALATQLDGTGSDPRPSQQKTYLLSEMRAHKVPKPKGVLASPNTSLVLVRGFIPPGIRKGERFDVEIRTLPRSETKSLRNGFLMQTNLRQMEATGGRVLKGHVVGSAKGPIVVDAAFDNGEESNEIRGRVMGGAYAKFDRPLGLSVNSGRLSVHVTTALARAINRRFHVIENGGKVGAAKPKNDRHIELSIPQKYKNNLARYLEVVKSIKFREKPAELSQRLLTLQKQLIEPSTTKRAALHLEAIGESAREILKSGLEAGDEEVRFHSAMALAYLDDPSSTRELGTAAKIEPAFRWHAMTALSTLDDVDAGIQLMELLNLRSAETRYGAFAALRERSPGKDIFETQVRPSDFFLHSVPSLEFPLIHFSRYRRPELTLFGHEQTVKDNFLYVKSGLTIRAIEGDKIKVSSFSRRDGDETRTCSNKVADLIEVLVEFDFEYGDILDVFKQAKSQGMLNSKLVVDATPKPRRYQRSSDTESDPENPEEESSRYVAGPLPNLYQNQQRQEQQWRPDSSAVYFEEEKKEKKGMFARMTGWWKKD